MAKKITRKKTKKVTSKKSATKGPTTPTTVADYRKKIGVPIKQNAGLLRGRQRLQEISQARAAINEEFKTSPGKKRFAQLAVNRVTLEQEVETIKGRMSGLHEGLTTSLISIEQGELFDLGVVVRNPVNNKPMTDKLVSEMNESFGKSDKERKATTDCASPGVKANPASNEGDNSDELFDGKKADPKPKAGTHVKTKDGKPPRKKSATRKLGAGK